MEDPFVLFLGSPTAHPSWQAVRALLLRGPHGAGKSHLAQAVAHAVAAPGGRWALSR